MGGRSLFGLTGDALALHSLIEEYAEAHDGDLTEVAPIIEAWEKELNLGLEAKAEAYARVVVERNARADARRAEAKRLTEAARADEAVAERLKGYLTTAMDAAGETKLNAGVYAIALVNNGGLTPMELLVEPAKLPDPFRIMVPKADTDAIRAALTKGDPKAAEVAKFLPRGRWLRIK